MGGKRQAAGALVAAMTGETPGGQNRMDLAIEIDWSGRADSRHQNRCGEGPFHLLISWSSASGPSTSTIRTLRFLRFSRADSGTSKRDTIMRSMVARPRILSRMIRLSLYFWPNAG